MLEQLNDLQYLDTKMLDSHSVELIPIVADIKRSLNQSNVLFTSVFLKTVFVHYCV